MPKRGGEGPIRSVRTVAVEEGLLNAVDNDPSTSVRKLSREHNVSKSSVHRILKEQLLYPFHVQKVHSMTAADYPARLEYSQWFLRQQQADNTFVSNVLFTDESGFTRDGVMNSRNMHLWDDENPHGTIQTRNQHRFMVNVWAGIVGNHLIGPYFIDGILTGQKYLNFLQNEFWNLFDDVPLQTRRNLWFMHDGAPPHFSLDVRHHLNRKFPNRWIGRGGPVQWPSRSGDINPMDFFFWGYLKHLVYATPVITRQDLIDRIVLHCNAIKDNPGLLFKVQRNNLRRLRKCVEVGGAHIEHLI